MDDRFDPDQQAVRLQALHRLLRVLSKPEVQEKLKELTKLRELKVWVGVLLALHVIRSPLKALFGGLQSQQALSEIDRIRLQQKNLDHRITYELFKGTLIIPDNWARCLTHAVKYFVIHCNKLFVEFICSSPRISAGISLALVYLYREALRQFLVNIIDFVKQNQNGGH
jgi:hypothetical protein